jgi:predicted nucleotidyltransferase
MIFNALIKIRNFFMSDSQKYFDVSKTSRNTGTMTRDKDLSRNDIRALRDVFQRYPSIQAVYVFGSMGSGKMHPESDLDLAIVSRSRALKKKKLQLLTVLASIGFCDVDLVFLDTKDIVLKYEVVRQNRLIYAVEDFDRGSMYSKIIRQYLDFAPYLEIQRKAYKRRIERGSTGNHSQAIEQTG